MQKEEVSTTKKVFTIILAICLFSAMGTGFYLSRKENKEIDNNLKTMKGVVIDVYSQSSRGETCVYEINIKGIKYQNHEALGKHRINIGDSVFVEYSSKNPEYSRINFEK